MFTVLLIPACTPDEPTITIENPVSYEFLRAGSSTVSFDGQSTRIGMATELIDAMKDNGTSEATLLEMYANEAMSGPFNDETLNESTKSIKSKVAASYDLFSNNTVESAEIKATIASWISAQVTEVFPSYNQLASVGVAGQIADGSSVRYVSAKGLEYNQAVNKSLIGALMVDQMLNNYLSTAVLDNADNIDNNDNEIVEEGNSYTTMEHKWDEAYGYLFGATGINPSDPLSNLDPDNFLAKYLGSVDADNDFAGIASDIFEAFKLGRAAIVANDYQVRDDQVNIIKTKVSEVVAIRAVFYLQQGKFAKQSSDFGGAFHDLSEGLGFVYSLRFLPKANSSDVYFSKSEVDGFINALTTGNGFWDVDATTLDQISSAIANKFDFTVTQAGS